MRRLMGWCGMAVAGLVLIGPVAAADEKDKKVDLDKVPKAVREAVKARFPAGEVTSVEKETADGKVVYDIELKEKGRKYEMDIQEDGTVLEIEKEVPLKDLPKAVTDAIEAKYPKAKVTEVMEVNKVAGKKETPIHYEATIDTADKKGLEVIVSLDGKSVKTEDEVKKEEEKKK